jgi:hypothetical protein
MDHGDYFSGYDDKPTVFLHNWSVVPDREPNPYQAPELIEPRLYGQVVGHPRHEDYTYVTTSPMLTSAGRVVETCNTIYNLGLMSQGYEEWCFHNGIDVDPKMPVKVERERSV